MSTVLHDILVRVHECRNLATMPNTLPSSYCVLEVGPSSCIHFETETQPDTVNPVWNKDFAVPRLALTPEQLRCEKLSFQVYDRRPFALNQLIGSYEFTLFNVHTAQQHGYHCKWVQLSCQNQRSERAQGFLLISVFVLGPGDLAPSLASPSMSYPSGDEKTALREDGYAVLASPGGGNSFVPYLLQVYVYKAVDVLTAHKFWGTLTPFVSVHFNGSVLDSPAVVGHDIDFNLKFTFPFFRSAAQLAFDNPDLHSDTIQVQLWNKRSGRPDQLIGQTTISFFKENLLLMPFGPKWEHMYSSDINSSSVSTLSALASSSTSSSFSSSLHTEYVGGLFVGCRTQKLDPHSNWPSQLTPAITPCINYAILKSLTPSIPYRLFLLLHRLELTAPLHLFPSSSGTCVRQNQNPADFVSADSSSPISNGSLRIEVVCGGKRVKSSWYPLQSSYSATAFTNARGEGGGGGLFSAFRNNSTAGAGDEHHRRGSTVSRKQIELERQQADARHGKAAAGGLELLQLDLDLFVPLLQAASATTSDEVLTEDHSFNLPDLIINVFHKIGLETYKMAAIRLCLKPLLNNRGFLVNGNRFLDPAVRQEGKAKGEGKTEKKAKRGKPLTAEEEWEAQIREAEGVIEEEKRRQADWDGLQRLWTPHWLPLLPAGGQLTFFQKSKDKQQQSVAQLLCSIGIGPVSYAPTRTELQPLLDPKYAERAWLRRREKRWKQEEEERKLKERSVLEKVLGKKTSPPPTAAEELADEEEDEDENGMRLYSLTLCLHHAAFLPMSTTASSSSSVNPFSEIGAMAKVAALLREEGEGKKGAKEEDREENREVYAVVKWGHLTQRINAAPRSRQMKTDNSSKTDDDREGDNSKTKNPFPFFYEKVTFAAVPVYYHQFPRFTISLFSSSSSSTEDGSLLLAWCSLEVESFLLLPSVRGTLLPDHTPLPANMTARQRKEKREENATPLWRFPLHPSSSPFSSSTLGSSSRPFLSSLSSSFLTPSQAQSVAPYLIGSLLLTATSLPPSSSSIQGFRRKPLVWNNIHTRPCSLPPTIPFDVKIDAVGLRYACLDKVRLPRDEPLVLELSCCSLEVQNNIATNAKTVLSEGREERETGDKNERGKRNKTPPKPSSLWCREIYSNQTLSFAVLPDVVGSMEGPTSYYCSTESSPSSEPSSPTAPSTLPSVFILRAQAPITDPFALPLFLRLFRGSSSPSSSKRPALAELCLSCVHFLSSDALNAIVPDHLHHDKPARALEDDARFQHIFRRPPLYKGGAGVEGWGGKVEAEREDWCMNDGSLEMPKSQKRDPVMARRQRRRSEPQVRSNGWATVLPTDFGGDAAEKMKHNKNDHGEQKVRRIVVVPELAHLAVAEREGGGGEGRRGERRGGGGISGHKQEALHGVPSRWSYHVLAELSYLDRVKRALDRLAHGGGDADFESIRRLLLEGEEGVVDLDDETKDKESEDVFQCKQDVSAQPFQQTSNGGVVRLSIHKIVQVKGEGDAAKKKRKILFWKKKEDAQLETGEERVEYSFHNSNILLPAYGYLSQLLSTDNKVYTGCGHETYQNILEEQDSALFSDELTAALEGGRENVVGEEWETRLISCTSSGLPASKIIPVDLTTPEKEASWNVVAARIGHSALFLPLPWSSGTFARGIQQTAATQPCCFLLAWISLTPSASLHRFFAMDSFKKQSQSELRARVWSELFSSQQAPASSVALSRNNPFNGFHHNKRYQLRLYIYSLSAGTSVHDLRKYLHPVPSRYVVIKNFAQGIQPEPSARSLQADVNGMESNRESDGQSAYRAGLVISNRDAIASGVPAKLFQPFVIDTLLPVQSALQISVYDINSGGVLQGGDALLGSTFIDLEWRLLHDLAMAGLEYRTLYATSSQTPYPSYNSVTTTTMATSSEKKGGNENRGIPQGKMLLRLEILNSFQAETRKMKIVPIIAGEFELRMVIWSTADVGKAGADFVRDEDRVGGNADRKAWDNTTNQVIEVTCNFSDLPNRSVGKRTITQWNVTDWALFNHRFKWPLTLPSARPRLELTLNDDRVLGYAAIGVAAIDLSAWFAQCVVQASSALQEWHLGPLAIPIISPSAKQTIGTIHVEFWLVPAAVATMRPVGEAQDEPNQYPKLEVPMVNAAPFSWGSQLEQRFLRQKHCLRFMLLSLVIAIPVAIFFILWMQSGSLLK